MYTDCMPAPKKAPAINLVPKDPFFDSPVGKILKWALSVGRYIVIFTELIVIVSFVTRFSLDRQVTDLNKEIFQKETVVRSYGDLEQNVRLTQKKIEGYRQIEQQENLADIFPQLSQLTPRGIVLDSLSITPEVISFNGQAQSQEVFSSFITNIELSGELGWVTVNQIDSGEEAAAGQLIFDVSIARPTGKAEATGGSRG